MSKYTQSEFGKLDTKEALETVNELEPGQDSAIYIQIFAEQISKGIPEFGIEKAKELIAHMIAKGLFVPTPLKKDK